MVCTNDGRQRTRPALSPLKIFAIVWLARDLLSFGLRSSRRTDEQSYSLCRDLEMMLFKGAMIALIEIFPIFLVATKRLYKSVCPSRSGICRVYGLVFLGRPMTIVEYTESIKIQGEKPRKTERPPYRSNAWAKLANFFGEGALM